MQVEFVLRRSKAMQRTRTSVTYGWHWQRTAVVSDSTSVSRWQAGSHTGRQLSRLVKLHICLHSSTCACRHSCPERGLSCPPVNKNKKATTLTSQLQKRAPYKRWCAREARNVFERLYTIDMWQHQKPDMGRNTWQTSRPCGAKRNYAHKVT